MDAPILITGISGFIGIHCAFEALRAGYRVRGALRDKPGEDRRAKLRSLIAAELGEDPGERLSFVSIDLLADAGWAEAVEGCPFVLHVASPVPQGAIPDPDAFVAPAREGALRLLRAAAASEPTRRVVLTSSSAALFYGHRRGPEDRYGPEDWSLPEHCPAYPRSKTLAERAAWDYVATLEPGVLELVTILPCMVYGPVPDPCVYSPSGEPIRKLLAREIFACPNFGWGTVDVREVAQLHVRAAEVQAAAGERIVLGEEHLSLREIAQILAPVYRPRGYRIPTASMPDWMVRLAAYFDPQVRLALPDLGLYERVDSSRARELLGWQPRPVASSILDMAESLIACGLV